MVKTEFKGRWGTYDKNRTIKQDKSYQTRQQQKIKKIIKLIQTINNNAQISITDQYKYTIRIVYQQNTSRTINGLNKYIGMCT